MRVPAHADAFQVLLLQAADGGRGFLLFGGRLARAGLPDGNKRSGEEPDRPNDAEG